MAGADRFERLGRRLVPVIAVVLAVGGVLATTGWRYDPALARPEGAAVVDVFVPSPRDGDRTIREAVESHPSPSGDPLVGSVDASAGEGQAPVRIAVPVAGEYVYDVRSDLDGTVSRREEVRRVEVDTSAPATVRVASTADGETQTSVLSWTPAGTTVVSTAVAGEGGGRSCVWDPPFVDLGPLRGGETWTVDSSCATDVAGIATRVSVRGESRVLGSARIDLGSGPVEVWRIERDRTTVLRAEVGSDGLERRTRERGRYDVDAVRGVVVRSDVTIEVSGPHDGTTRRISVLRDAPG